MVFVDSPTCDVVQSVDTTCDEGNKLARFAPSDYPDGVSAMPTDRKSAREISNIVGVQSESITNSRDASDMIWQWGQFLDHDVIETPSNGDDKANIPVPTGDQFFDPDGDENSPPKFISFSRSTVYDGTGVTTPREQINGITSCIDGSNVYGSDIERQAALRTNSGDGKLKVQDSDNGPLMPFNHPNLDNAMSNGAHFFLAGDVRANEQVALTAMHTLFVREHNFQAERILAENPTMSGNEVFAAARKWVTALKQKITYDDWLPVFIGADNIAAYNGFNQLMKPAIFNEFATAAFRVGHTLLSDTLLRPAVNGAGGDSPLPLRDAFFNISYILEHGIDSVLKGLTMQKAQEVDGKFVDSVRNFLFGMPGAGGFDLFALNIQRGRDHGLPSLNAMRSAMKELGYPTDPYQSINDITTNPDHRQQLTDAYGTVDKVELFVGGLLEDKASNSMLGDTFTCIWAEQFRRFRDGYKLYYEIDDFFSAQDRASIKATTLKDIIVRNTDIPANELMDDVFIVPGY